MPSAYRQFRWRCIQKIIAGLAIGLGGVVLVFSEISFGAVTIAQSAWFGTMIAATGLLYAASSVAALHGRRKPVHYS